MIILKHIELKKLRFYCLIGEHAIQIVFHILQKIVDFFRNAIKFLLLDTYVIHSTTWFHVTRYNEVLFFQRDEL